MANKKALIAAVVAILLLFGGGVVVLRKKNLKPTIKPVQQGQPKQYEDVDTSDWKTYINEEHGFEIKYPADFAVIDTSTFSHITEIRFHKGGRKGPLLFSINVSSREVKSLSETEEGIKREHGQKVTTEMITLNNMPALKVVYSGSPQSPGIEVISFINDGKGFGLYFDVTGVPNISEEKDDILSSLRFTR